MFIFAAMFAIALILILLYKYYYGASSAEKFPTAAELKEMQCKHGKVNYLATRARPDISRASYGLRNSPREFTAAVNEAETTSVSRPGPIIYFVPSAVGRARCYHTREHCSSLANSVFVCKATACKLCLKSIDAPVSSHLD